MSSVISDYCHPAIEAVAAINAGLDELAAASLWSLRAAELAELIVAAEKIGRRIAAVQLPLLAQADSTGLASELASTSTPSWLRSVADVPFGVGKARAAGAPVAGFPPGRRSCLCRRGYQPRGRHRGVRG